MLEKLQPSLVNRQGGGPASWVWLNGEFCTKPWTQTVPKAPQSPPDLIEDKVSGLESAWSDSDSEGRSSVATRPLGSTVYKMS